jgi:dynein heavy chain
VVARGLLNGIAEKASYVPQFINFSAQTSSKRTQEMIEGKLEKRRKNIIGAPVGKRVIIFVDDLNMPKLDTYGSQPPIELLRQYQDFGGMYDREKLFWKEIQVKICLCLVCLCHQMWYKFMYRQQMWYEFMYRQQMWYEFMYRQQLN